MTSHRRAGRRCADGAGVGVAAQSGDKRAHRREQVQQVDDCVGAVKNLNLPAKKLAQIEKILA